MTQDAQVDALEAKLLESPGDMQAMRRLVTLLDQKPAAYQGAGRFTSAQNAIARALPGDWSVAFLNADTGAAYVRDWLDAVHSAGIARCVPIGQIFAGRTMTINGTHAHCGARLKFFKETEVIPGLCHDCYKVQILPDSVEGLIRVYFLLINLNLPDDNARKCMIELREGIKFPYKAYIYCQSVEEAKSCLDTFRKAQADFGIEGVRSKISHGCSEYGQTHPTFKYAEGEVQRFETPNHWAKIERDYFQKINLTPPKRTNNSKPFISLRDVFAFYTWIRYAGLIEDPSAERYLTDTTPELPPVFVDRVNQQADRRRDELVELRD